MDFAPIYLIVRLARGIGVFFVHWYQNGTAYFVHAWRAIVLGLEQSLALKETIAHITQPLYSDYSMVGRIVGPVFRLIRAAIAIVLYIAISVGVGLLYLVWIAIPAAILFVILHGTA